MTAHRICLVRGHVLNLVHQNNIAHEEYESVLVIHAPELVLGTCQELAGGGNKTAMSDERRLHLDTSRLRTSRSSFSDAANRLSYDPYLSAAILDARGEQTKTKFQDYRAAQNNLIWIFGTIEEPSWDRPIEERENIFNTAPSAVTVVLLDKASVMTM